MHRYLHLLLVLLLVTAVAGCAASEAAERVEDEQARTDYYEQAAKTYYDGGRYDSSIGMWDKVLASRPNDQWAQFGLAKALQMEGSVRSLRRAEEILKDLVNLQWIHPTRGDIRFEVQSTFANVYSDLATFYDRDARILEQRLENDPNADVATVEEQIRVQRAHRDRLLRASIPIWRRVLEASPDNPYALAGLAKAHLLTGNEDAGIRFAQRYIEISRRSQEGWREKLREWEQMMRGDVSPEQRGFYMAKIQGAAEKEKNMHLLLGAVYMRRDEFANAVRCYDAVLELDPATPAAYVERAQAHAAVGLYDEAIEDLEQYLKMTDPQKHRRAR
ncbi:MAG: tetratricopeptide repeat protein, partial [Planctomycetota bacterium]